MARWNGFWTRRTDVQRVDLYTRWSFYLIAWWMNISLLGTALAELGGAAASALPLLVVTVVLTVAATAGIGRVLDLHPRDPLDDPRARRIVVGVVVLALAVLVSAALLPLEGRVAAVGVAFSTTAWVLGGVRHRVVAAAAPAALLVGALLLVPDRPGSAVAFLLVHVFFVFTVRASLWLLGVVRELDVGRAAQSELAVAEERLRFSRDVHDVLGRHLSTIAVQAELAATLAQRGDERAAATMLDVRSAAHEALREARALARGYRPTDLAAELRGARSLLTSAGIRCEVGVDEVPEEWHEAAGWVIREAVTNVLRHSSATRVLVRWQAGELLVENDGARGERGTGVDTGVDTGSDTGGGAGAGSGLIGLAERLAPLGAELDARRDDDCFRVRVRFPVRATGAPAPEEVEA
ncbi:histidine kinase [Nocardioides sp. ChNu-99]|uniref:sensor histidine kinase n=1 Tax=Nocardioides sp. ChNu-99 TaxID=2839897 RepID=UPI0024077520|nr:histidine kinase [Nocardioides sp. ChNu-99]MDF9717542.1 hypothetical protein [Nocardioides sp. ChNu-99]